MTDEMAVVAPTFNFFSSFREGTLSYFRSFLGSWLYLCTNMRCIFIRYLVIAAVVNPKKPS